MISDTETLTVIRLTDAECTLLADALETIADNPVNRDKPPAPRLTDEQTDLLDELRYALR